MTTIQQIPAAAYGAPQTFVDRVVLHGTVSPCQSGEAAANARYLNQVGLSVHYLVDPTGIAQMLPESTIGYHDGHNVNEVGIELCDPQAGDPGRWADAEHQQMLALAAPLVAGICDRWSVPKSRIRADLRVPPTRGITGHIEVTNTWHESTHVDPDQAGPFPWDSFIAQVNGGTPPVPEDIMTPAQEAKLDAFITMAKTFYNNTEYGGDPANATDRYGWRPGNLQLLTQGQELLAAIQALAAKVGNPATVQVDATSAQQIGNQILAALGPALGAQVADHIQITVTGK